MEISFAHKTDMGWIYQKSKRFGLIIVSFLVLLMLLISSMFIDLSRIHLGPADRHLNDQVGYVTTARNITETGKATSNIIYPSTLYQSTTKNYLYMPGHYFTMAAIFKLLGFGLLQSYLPNILSYFFSSIIIYLVGRRLFNHLIGLMGALLFILFPINVLYAYSAMSEMTLVLSTILAFCLFVYLPDSWKPYLGPLVLCAPLIFRETGILLAIPLAWLIFKGEKKNIIPTLTFLVISLVVIGFILTSNFITGRPSLFLANIFDDRFETIYQDALAMQSISPELLDWPRALISNFVDNITWIFNKIILFDPSFDLILFLAIISMGIFTILWGFQNKDDFLLATGLFTIVTFLAILTLYSVYSYRGLRVILFTLPLNVIAIAHVLLDGLKRYTSFGRRVTYNYLISIVVIALIPICMISIALMANKFSSMDVVDDQNTAFLENLGHDDHKMLVAPYELSLNYVYNHYPVEWSFIPPNPYTFELLSKYYEVGTIIIPRGIFDRSFKINYFDKFNISYERSVKYNGIEYLLFKHNYVDN